MPSVIGDNTMANEKKETVVTGPALTPSQQRKSDEEAKREKAEEDKKKPEPGTKDNLKPGQVLTQDQLEEDRKKQQGDEKVVTSDKYGNLLYEGSHVTVEAVVTKADDGKVELEIANPVGDAIKVPSAPSSLFGSTPYNPRIGANPLRRGPGIRETPTKFGGVNPVSVRTDDNKSIADISEQAWDRAQSHEPVFAKRQEEMDAKAKGEAEQRKAQEGKAKVHQHPGSEHKDQKAA